MSIEKLKAAYEAATPGKWVADDNRTAMAYAGWELVAVDEVPPRAFAVAMPQQEAEFIVMAHNMMPALLRMGELFTKLEDHLDWVGWGDSYERECSAELRKELAEFHAMEELK